MDLYKNYDKDFVATPESSLPVITYDSQKRSSGASPQPRPALRMAAWILLAALIILASVAAYAYNRFNAEIAPATIPMVIEIPKGSSLQTATNILNDNNLISSPLLFRILVILRGDEQSVKTGEYTFNRPMRLTETIDKLVNGKYEYVPVRLTIREGENAKEIATAIDSAFARISYDEAYVAIKDREGRLFPETYNFPPFATMDLIIRTVEREFEDRISVFRGAMASSSRSELEILTIASILEREVPQKADMKVVSGIIYNRLSKDMPLQMDSTLGFITGKASLELTTEDLKVDSPYNTYVNKGLPPGPIGNPGDIAIEAAINPDINGYIFFLSDKDGVNHYAVTYAEHLKNRRTYLGK